MKYVCSVCGYEYDPAENDNVPFDQAKSAITDQAPS